MGNMGRFVVIGLMAIIAAVSAGFIDIPRRSLVGRTGGGGRGVDQFANFDDLTVGPVVFLNGVPVPYKGLNYSVFIVQTAGTAGLLPGVVPQSGSQYAAYGPESQVTGSPNELTTEGTKTKSFDLQEFYFGCVTSSFAEQAQTAIACTISVTPTYYLSRKKGKAALFTFTPDSLTNAKMQSAKFSKGFTGLKSAKINIESSGTSVLTAFLLDSARYKTFS